VIEDWINAKNIAKVAQVFMSNFYENFFLILTKYSQGKRINLGMTDSWELYQHADMCSNEWNGSIFVSKVIVLWVSVQAVFVIDILYKPIKRPN
jgi:hypothetical protein